MLLRSQAQAALLSKSTGCKGTYSLMRLPTHNRDTQLVPDAMHTITDVVEKLLYLIIGKLEFIVVHTQHASLNNYREDKRQNEWQSDKSRDSTGEVWTAAYLRFNIS